MAKFGEARCDENGNVSYGLPGDQTGREVAVSEFTENPSKPWVYIFRAKDKAIAKNLALYMEQACANDHIGYAQYKNTVNQYADRYGLYFALQKYHSLPEIREDCNCDCSSLVSQVVNLAGLKVSIYMSTSNEVSELEKTGAFDKIAYSKDNLVTGDILWRNGHTGIIVEGDEEKESVFVGIATVTTNVNLRTGPVNMGGLNLCNVDRNDGLGVRHVLYTGETAKVISGEGNWWELEIVGKEYTWYPWCTRSAVSVKIVEEPTEKERIGVATTMVNLRTSPENKGIFNFCYINKNDGLGKRHVLNKDETAKIINENDKWYQLEIKCGKTVLHPWCTKSAMIAKEV